MSTVFDHATIVVTDLDAAIASYRRLGFRVGERHEDLDGAGDSAFVHVGTAYVELTSRGASDGVRPGLHGLAVESDDLAGDIEALRERGLEVGDVVNRRLRTPAGDEVSWREVDVRETLPLTLVQHLVRPRPEAGGDATPEHPNTASRLERAYVAVPDVQAAAELYARILDLPVPPLERGMVIKSQMAVFAVGPVGLGLAEPFGEGVTADALEAWGTAPFQILFHAESIDTAAEFMQQQGLPEPARGVRLSGEHAVLVQPEHACGAYTVLAGPQ